MKFFHLTKLCYKTIADISHQWYTPPDKLFACEPPVVHALLNVLIAKKLDVEILMNLHVLGLPESKEVCLGDHAPVVFHLRVCEDAHSENATS
ncbi:hypothetical protein AVEN_134030-1 [Araneus ventricosus]|uniref:Uncharacterized protein n=1 Tax=Araneus ventricosus TaxID=182803 RepID=A0A4Y2K654_ARAVE|nr:hypothetical protein AVEN_134030-1 [Araneus ventricosus]